MVRINYVIVITKRTSSRIPRTPLNKEPAPAYRALARCRPWIFVSVHFCTVFTDCLCLEWLTTKPVRGDSFRAAAI
jgi:hypothetical protein